VDRLLFIVEDNMRRTAEGKIKHVKVDQMCYCPKCAKYCVGSVCTKCGSQLIEAADGKSASK
jgi:glyoxylate utilization-related uncharacterized protein